MKECELWEMFVFKQIALVVVFRQLVGFLTNLFLILHLHNLYIHIIEAM